MDYTKNIREYLAQKYEGEIADEENLYQSGVLDSMSTFELIGWITDDLGVEIEPEDITEENFSSIKAINTLLISKDE